MTECSNKNKLITFCSIALNIFLIAFLIGRCNDMHQLKATEKMMMHNLPQEAASTPRGYGLFGHPGAIMSQALFSKIEIEADRPFVEEHFERIHSLRKDLANQLRNGKATPESIKTKFAEIDGIMKEVKDHMRKKATDKILSMSPEEKKRLADILEK